MTTTTNPLQYLEPTLSELIRTYDRVDPPRRAFLRAAFAAFPREWERFAAETGASARDERPAEWENRMRAVLDRLWAEHVGA
jgi:hypothetical protein